MGGGGMGQKFSFLLHFRFLWLDLTSNRRLWGNGRRGQFSENQTNLVFAQSESDFAIRSIILLWLSRDDQYLLHDICERTEIFFVRLKKKIMFVMMIDERKFHQTLLCSNYILMMIIGNIYKFQYLKFCNQYWYWYFSNRNVDTDAIPLFYF